jgi:DnaJ-class molecular chaperone
VPPGANGGRSFRLKGKGLPAAGGERGDILVSLRIVLPEEPSPELEELMKQWREAGGTNVRGSEYQR